MRARLLIGLTLIAVAAPAVVAAEETEPRSRAARRTPVVEVFERNRGAVVNISATMEVEGYQTIFPDGLFNEFFDGMPPRPSKRKYSSIVRGLFHRKKRGNKGRLGKIQQPGGRSMMLHQSQAAQVVFKDVRIGQVIVSFPVKNTDGPGFTLRPARFVWHKVL